MKEEEWLYIGRSMNPFVVRCCGLHLMRDAGFDVVSLQL